MTRHTIVIEISDHIKLPLDQMEAELHDAIEAIELVYAREIHRPVTVVEYHREQVTGPSEAGTSFESDEEAGTPVFKED